MAVVSDGESYEKILIFGGIVNDVSNATQISEVKSTISNQAYILNVN